MYRGNGRRVGLALILVVGATTFGASTAGGTTGQRRTQPAGATPVLVDLGLSVTVPRATSRLVTSHLVVGSAGELTAVSHLVHCRLAGSTTVTERILSGQNVPRAVQVTLVTRALVAAPTTGALTCRLYVILINHTSTRVFGTISILAGTNLQAIAVAPSSENAWQVSQALVNTAYTAVPVRLSLAGTRSLHALGDVNITACYYASKGLCLGAGSRRSADYAYVGTQLVVQQLHSTGAVCRTFVDGPLVGATVSSTLHHLKINKSIVNIPVSSSCTSRTFQAHVRVTANGRANSIIVEPNHQSVACLYVRL